MLRVRQIHYVRIQHSFLLQIVRYRVLGQQRRFQLDLSADPFAFGMGLVSGMFAVPLDPNFGPNAALWISSNWRRLRQASSPTVPETSILSFTMAIKSFHHGGHRDTEKS